MILLLATQGAWGGIVALDQSGEQSGLVSADQMLEILGERGHSAEAPVYGESDEGLGGFQLTNSSAAVSLSASAVQATDVACLPPLVERTLLSNLPLPSDPNLDGLLKPPRAWMTCIRFFV